MNLSKSKYTRFCQCPKMLWLDTYHPELAVQDEALLRRFQEGNEIGDLAMGLLGEFVETTAYTADGKLDIPSMLKNTKKYLIEGRENICEAAFSKNGCYCAVDILHKAEDGYEIYEVKSSTEIKDVYLWDVAYQRWVLEQSGLKIVGTYIVYIDNTYVRHGDIDIHKLFAIQNVSDAILPYYTEVAQNTARAKEYIAQKNEPVMELGEQCSSPYDCAYWQYCARALPSPNVFDLYRMQSKKACEYLRQGIISFGDVVKSGIPLNATQRRQVEFEQLQLPTHIDRLGIKSFLETLWYPLYFLDFETFQTGVPLYDGLRPYQQVPFQYSLHILTNEGATLEHKEFLADENSDPRRALAERLAADIPTDVCVLAYNKGFECGRLKELSETFPDLAEKLLAIRENVRDLLDVFRNGYVYDRAMGGSFSIKKVLPALFPNDPNLDYHNLADVHNGGEATDTYLALRGMEQSERDKLRQSLLAYCGLDTLAMVMLWQRLREFCVGK